MLPLPGAWDSSPSQIPTCVLTKKSPPRSHPPILSLMPFNLVLKPPNPATPLGWALAFLWDACHGLQVKLVWRRLETGGCGAVTGGGMQAGSKEGCLAWAAGGTELGNEAGWRNYSVDTSISEGEIKAAWQWMLVRDVQTCWSPARCRSKSSTS